MADKEKALSTYNLQEDWLTNIAPKYLKVEDQNLLRVGLMGYVNEIMANEVEDSAHQFAILSAEIFPNKAVLPTSIYAYSSLARYENMYATPSRMTFLFAIKKDNLISASIDDGNYKKYYIGKDTKIIVEDKYTFTLDYDILLRIKEIETSNYSVSAYYLMDHKNPTSKITSPYIQTMQITDRGDEYVVLKIDAQQVVRETQSFTVTSQVVLDQLKYKFSFDKQLAGFNVYYSSSNLYNGQTIELAKYFVDSVAPSEKFFCFYEFATDNEIEIIFSPYGSYFRPEYNSTITIEKYLTDGINGNFVYTGNNIKINYAQSEYATHNYTRVYTFASALSSSENGTDMKLISEIKDDVIREFSIRRNIITPLDLQNYFLNRTGRSEILFTKQRDDLLRRIYTAYFLLRSEDEEIYPTNSINLKVHNTYFEGDEIASTIKTIPTGTLFIKDLDNPDTFVALENVDDFSFNNIKALETTNTFVYSNPFLIKLSTDPVGSFFYINSVNDDYYTVYNWLNDSIINEFSINSFAVIRNALVTNQYTVRLGLVTNLDPNDIATFDDFGFDSAKPEFKLKLVFNSEGEKVGYINMIMVNYEEENNTFIYEGTFTTDDVIDDDNKIRILDLIDVNTTSEETEEFIEEVFVSNEDLNFSILLFTNKFASYTTERWQYKDIPFNLSMDYALVVALEAEKNVALFYSMDQLIHSKTYFTRNADDYFFILDRAPVVRSSFIYHDPASIYKFLTLFKNFFETLSAIKEVTENNFDIDCKFYNSHGTPVYLNIGAAQDPLLRSDIKIEFNIRLSTSITEVLIYEIKQFIKQKIEGSNYQSSSAFFISDLIKELKVKFTEISFMEFLGMDDYNVENQVIRSNFPGMEFLTTEQTIKFVPEFLTTRLEFDESSNSFLPQIKLNFI